MLPKALVSLIDALGHLPGVGPRTAERYAYFLLRSDYHAIERLTSALSNIKSGVKVCPITFELIDDTEEISPIYANKERDKQLVAIVEEPLDVIALERTRQFTGTYHVLGGAISPIDGVGPEALHIPELIERLKKDAVKEIIIATNASVEGESTALYLQRYINDAGLEISITRLARGIPVGVDLEYADQITLTHALEGRREMV